MTDPRLMASSEARRAACVTAPNGDRMLPASVRVTASGDDWAVILDYGSFRRVLSTGTASDADAIAWAIATVTRCPCDTSELPTFDGSSLMDVSG